MMNAAADDRYHLVFCTAPTRDSAETIANALVDQRLAACVNILPGVRSVYLWQGQREHSDELLLLIKARAATYPALEQAILALHPYELPEIIAVSLDAGLPRYLAWIAATT